MFFKAFQLPPKNSGSGPRLLGLFFRRPSLPLALDPGGGERIQVLVHVTALLCGGPLDTMAHVLAAVLRLSQFLRDKVLFVLDPGALEILNHLSFTTEEFIMFSSRD